MKSKNINVEIEINEHGCPIVEAPERAFASAKFSAASSEWPHDLITIEGNRAGLRTLARWMLAIADQDSASDHQQFDNDMGFGFFKSDTDCDLIIQRIEK
ncbi:hypothetical protein OAG68_01035 [bacterium]|nr:hypothetical protein [bacterium]